MNANYDNWKLKSRDDDIQEYVFEVHGEFIITARSEREAEEIVESEIRDILYEAYSDGMIDVS